MRPRLVVHNEVSVDGRMDWYVGDMGLYYEVAARLGADASLVGSETIISGLEQFGDGAAPGTSDTEAKAGAPEVEQGPEGRPGNGASEADGGAGADVGLLVVVDSRGRVKEWPLLKRQPYWSDILVLCSEATRGEYLRELDELGIAYLIRGKDKVDLPIALAELGKQYGIRTLRVDSGGTLTGVLLRAGLVDEISVMIDPCVAGGESPASMFRAPDLTSAEGLTGLTLRTVEKLSGDVVWLRYDVTDRE